MKWSSYIKDRFYNYSALISKTAAAALHWGKLMHNHKRKLTHWSVNLWRKKTPHFLIKY
jgi:hypothetical protein